MENFRIKLLASVLCGLLSSSCADDERENDPLIPEQEEDEVIYGTPTEYEIGKLYDISHDRKTWPWHCTFGFYFGDNPSEELIKRFCDCTIQVNYYSQTGYLGSTHVRPEDLSRSNYQIGDTFTLPYYTCEQIVKFEIIIRPTDKEKRKNGARERWEQDFKPVHDYFKNFR